MPLACWIARPSARAWRFAPFLGAALVCMPAAVAQAQKAYIPSYFLGSVSVIDTKTNKIATTIADPHGPQGEAVSPDGTRVYLANSDNTVSIINTSTDKLVSTFSPIGTEDLMWDIYVHPNGKKLYGMLSSSLVVIDVAKKAYKSGIGLPGNGRSLVFSLDGTKAYVTTYGGKIAIIDTTIDNFVGSIAMPAQFLEGLAISPDGKTLLASDQTNKLIFVDLPSAKVTATITGGNAPQNIVMSPDGRMAYITNYSSGVSVVDIVHRKVLSTIGTSGLGIDITPDGKTVYVVGGEVFPIDTKTNAEEAPIDVGYLSLIRRNFISPAPICHATGSAVAATQCLVPPKIFFNGTDTAALPNPIPVVVGQKIAMTAEPAGSGVSQPWHIIDTSGAEANIIGSYAAPSRPCSGTLCGPAVALAAVLSNPSAATFYWVTSGSATPKVFHVKYSFLNQSGSAQDLVADFEVDGPRAIQSQVSISPPPHKTRPVIIIQKDGLHPNPGIYFQSTGASPTPGIAFSGSVANAVKHDGYFFWAQVTEISQILKFNDGSSAKKIESEFHLDNEYPDTHDCYVQNATDSPFQRIIDRSVSELQYDFKAQMYLMWNSGFPAGVPAPNTIAVPIGEVPWYVAADVVQVSGVLSPKVVGSQPGQGGALSSFSPVGAFSQKDPTLQFPQWTDVNVNSGKLVPPCP